MVDNSCADISFSDTFIFSSMTADFDLKISVYCHKLRDLHKKMSGARAWLRSLKSMLGSRSSFLVNKKAINFKLLTTKHLTLEDCSSELK